ncbi:Tyrosinase [Metarhizium robertsii ARSEF 23]|uniref:tyrosinase n=1 Tax=Metarhizium robertsii (strain ARSEF 23 / ATCC MYA-3075) TaxID=655844 RepID=E9F8C4_METRA|nr:Tyrosinase [Metarhizium robertsii ARSEF 23]EFY96031.1 Tyrosinase [Metarhizium robertsii ARSEF 23]
MGVHNRLKHLTRKDVEALQPLPSEGSAIPNNRYVIKHEAEDSVQANNADIHPKIWFKSQPLRTQTIRRIRGVKLFAESRDQGIVSNIGNGNWSWFELAILENESATNPRKTHTGIELVSMSHENNLASKEYTWLHGGTFDKTRDILKWLEDGNVIAVRLCARSLKCATYARHGHLVIDVGNDEDAVPITPIDWHPAKEIPHRRNVHEWFAEAQEPQASKDAKLELSLFIPAMAKFQRLGLGDQLSYFRIAGIHGSPPNVSWNMGREPIPYDSPDMEERKKKGQGGNYCPHNKFVFPTWHRAYLMLFEWRVGQLMMEEAKTRRDHVDKWISAAKRWRLPYWDWARQPSLPGLVSNEKISILGADGTMKEVANPMYRFQMPGARRMGDPHYGDYRIDGNGDGPWDLCIGTCRHSISYYDDNWRKGHSDASKVASALQGPRLLKNTVTIKDGVFRLLTCSYSTQYEHFASTKHKPNDEVEAKGYLSLESIHNSVHDYIGGSDLVRGCGHMSSVPVAAFDPVFWLHHCNVDRLLYLWQTINPSSWFDASSQLNRTGTSMRVRHDDDALTDLVPFRRSTHDFFDSNGVRVTDSLGYTYDDVKHIINDKGQVELQKRNTHINSLYGPAQPNFQNSKKRDVDPIINVVYNRYAFGGLPYALHFFLGPLERNVPYHQQRHLVGSVHTFSAPLTNYQGSTGCSNCREQASDGILSRAQIPLTRSVPVEHRGTHDEAMDHFREKLQWVVVLNTGAKVPSDAVKDLSVTLLLGANQLEGGLEGVPRFGEYEAKEFDWDSAEL